MQRNIYCTKFSLDLATAKTFKMSQITDEIDLAALSLVNTTENCATIAKKELLDLNEDCLIQLFRYLPVKSLNATSATCRRFYGIVVKNNLHKYYSNVTYLNIAPMAKRYKNKVNGDDANQKYIANCFQQYFKRFGHIIKAIAYDGVVLKGVENRIFTFIANYCSDDLKTLKIRKASLFSETISNNRYMFGMLTTLEMDNYLNFSEVLPFCANLEELCLNMTRDQTLSEFAYEFKKLKAFTLHQHNNDTATAARLTEMLNLFFLKNLHLTSLSLSLSSTSLGPLNIGQLINLKELSLACSAQWNTQSIWNLSKLEKATLRYWSDENFAQFLRESLRESVETLNDLECSDYFFNDEFIEDLSHFQHLRHLTLREPRYSENISDNVIVQLHQLNKLISLSMENIPRAAGTKLISNLTGSHNTLQNLSWTGRFGDVFVANMALFVNLQTLELVKDDDDIHDPNNNYQDIVNWQPLQSLIQLKELTIENIEMNSSDGMERHLINNINSSNTLEMLKIGKADIDDGCIQAIGRFVNMKELLFETKSLTPTNMNILGQLSQVRKFTVFVHNSNKICSKSIMDLVANWKSLKHFEWFGGSVIDFDTEIIRDAKLTDILKTRNNFDQLAIKVCTHVVGAPIIEILPVN